MKFFNLMLYVYVLGICLPVALTYLIIVDLIFRRPIEPITIVTLAFGFTVMIKRNQLFHELIRKWLNKK